MIVGLLWREGGSGTQFLIHFFGIFEVCGLCECVGGCIYTLIGMLFGPDLIHDYIALDAIHLEPVLIRVSKHAV